MDTKDFICIACRQHTLDESGSALTCSGCGQIYPVRAGVPLLFPAGDVTTRVDGEEFSLGDIRTIYDKAYAHGGLMGTELDLEYDRTTKTILLDFAEPLAGKRLLDLGTGVGRLWAYAPADVVGFAVDPSMIGVAQAKHRRPDLTVSASIGECLPYDTGFFDVVVAADTLEHMLDLPAALAEIHRVLKPGGALSASLPIPQSLRKWGWNQVRTGRMTAAHLTRLVSVVAKRLWLFGKAAFQPIDRDLSMPEWSNTIEAAGFDIVRTVEWPDAPQTPIAYLVHVRKRS